MTDTYNPILRNGFNERQVVQSFGGFNHFDFGSSDHLIDLHPIVAVTSEEDLDDLHVYQDAGERVYVDFPEYLGEKATKYTEEINETLQDYSNREEFFRSNSDRIPFPMISGFPDAPVEYGIHISIHRALEEVYPRIAHRLMVRSTTNGLSERQQETLERLAETVRSDDVVMFDVVDVEFGPDSKVESDLENLSDLFSSLETGVLNVFNALQDQPDNHSPELAARFDCDSFGDFAIDRRYPPDGGGRPDSVNLVHYYPGQARAEIFSGNDYAEAGEDLLSWKEWDADHCDYCTDIATLVERRKGEDFSRWKRIRMGHYIESVLNGEI